MKRENEAVVNRFLLSTLYIILGEFLLFFMYKGSLSVRTAITMPGILMVLASISALGIIACIFFMVKGNKNAPYYLAISIAVLLITLFLRFYYVINIPALLNVFMYTAKRYVIAAIFALLFYVYEVVYYFMNVNKTQK